MNIIISEEGVRLSTDRELNATEDEIKIYEYVKSLITERGISLERRAENYLSIISGNDFMRIKYTPKTKWVSIFIPNGLREDLKESPLFEAQKKKTQAFWKSAINDIEDLEQLKDIIIKAEEEVYSMKDL